MMQRALPTEQLMVNALTSTGVRRLEAEIGVSAVLGALTATLLDWGRSGEGRLSDALRFALVELRRSSVRPFIIEGGSA